MKAFLISLCFAPLVAYASPQPVSLNFKDTSLMSFGEAMFKAVLQRDFVVSPDVIGSDKRITINVKNIDRQDLPKFVEDILLSQGVSTTLKDGVYYLSLERQHAASLVQERASQPLSVAQSPGPGAAASEALLGSPEAASRDLSVLVPASAQSLGTRLDDDESVLFTPLNRDTEFMLSLATSAFGARSAVRAGPHLALTGSKSSLAKLQRLLNAADTAPKGLTVSASWIEISRNDSGGRGISLLANVLGAKFGFSLGAVNSGSAISIKNSNFELVIDALNTDSRFKQVSNSRVSGDDYEPMNVTFGDETPTVSSTGKDNAGNLVQNVNYRPSGVIVDVVAKVLGSGRVKIAVDGQISSFKSTSTGVSNSPTLIKRQVKTTITLADGEVLLLGGLNDSQSSNSASRWPFLPAAWRATANTNVQTELVLVLSAKTNN